MKKTFVTLFFLLVAASMLASPVRQVSAQDKPPINAVETLPPPPPEEENPTLIPPVRQPTLEANAGKGGTRATGTPDSFGYTWTDEVPYSWVDATGGTQIALDGNGRSNTLTLTMPFRFYGAICSTIQLTNNGYLFCNDPSGKRTGFMMPILVYDVLGVTGIHMQTFGTSPNRYTVIEWYEVEDSVSPGDLQTFEIILYETSNDIKFQYHTLTLNSYFADIYSQLSKESNFSQDGLVSSTAIEYTYPVTPVTMFGNRQNNGALASMSDMWHYFYFQFTNTSNSDDQYELDILSETGSSPDWDLSFYYYAFGSGEWTPMSDSGGATTIDSGVVPAGSIFGFYAIIQNPASLEIGDTYNVNFKLTSSANASVSRTFSVSLTAGSPMIAREESGSTVFYSPNEISHTDFNQTTWVYSASINQIADGTYARASLSDDFQNINLSGFTKNGVIFMPETNITNNTDENIYPDYPVVAGSPDGTIAVAWAEDDTSTAQQSIKLAFRNGDGTQKFPIKTVFTFDPYVYTQQPQISVTSDNRFLLIWEEKYYDNYDGKYISNVYHVIYNSDGTLVQAMTADTVTTDNCNHYPNVSTVNGTQFFITYEEMTETSVQLIYKVVSSTGDSIKAPVTLTDTFGSANHVQLDDGSVILANRSHYYQLDTGFDITLGPLEHIDSTWFTCPWYPEYPGMIRDGANNVAIITSHYQSCTNGNYRGYDMNYALINGNTGNVIARHIITSPEFIVNGVADSFAPNYSSNVDLVVRGVDDVIYSGYVNAITGFVQNMGVSAATNITVTFTLPASAIYLGASESCTQSGQTITCTLSDLSYGESSMIQLFLLFPVGSEGDQIITMAASSDGPEVYLPDNATTITMTVEAVASVYIPILIR